MAMAPRTRQVLARRLVFDAATRPLNVGVPAAVVVVALVLGALWLVPVALLVYGGLVAETLFRGKAQVDRRSETVRQVDTARLPPELAGPLVESRAEAERIREAIAQAERPLPEVGDEVDQLIEETDRIARRGQLVHDYLAEQDPDAIERKLEQFRRDAAASPAAAGALHDAIAAHEEHLAVIRELEALIVRLAAELEHLRASLAVVRGQLLRVGAAEDSFMEQELARQLRELRGGVGG
jgi:hypothetical protein